MLLHYYLNVNYDLFSNLNQVVLLPKSNQSFHNVNHVELRFCKRETFRNVAIQRIRGLQKRPTAKKYLATGLVLKVSVEGEHLIESGRLFQSFEAEGWGKLINAVEQIDVGYWVKKHLFSSKPCL